VFDRIGTHVLWHTAVCFLFVAIFSLPAFADPIKLGWQVPWATQGQLVMALKHSNIGQQVGTDVSYIGFTYGGPLNRAALSGEIDILLTADQPALALLSRNPNFRIVARMMYNRVCIYVSPHSEIHNLMELAGRRVSGPVGAAAERIAISAIESVGVDLATVQFGNLDMAQQAAILRKSGGKTSWGGIDALYGFDPLPAVFEEQGLARILHCGNVIGVVVASHEMLAERRSELVRFLKSFALAWELFSREPTPLNALFAQESGLEVSQGVLKKAASIEPNYSAKALSNIRLTFNSEDIRSLSDAAHFLRARDIIAQHIVIESLIDLSPLQEALNDPALIGEAAHIRLDSRAK
jgi:ABC-type nitrate/sulfonate/bicarbonate transport system substrate-binding protein